MAHDEELAARFRAALGPRPGISEKRMMGGVCFLLNGNMIGGADRPRQGPRRFMFRLGKGNPAAASLPGGEPMIMGERAMPGFYFVAADDCSEAGLARWIAAASAHAASLPPK